MEGLKGISVLASAVFVILISVIAISLVLINSAPIIQTTRESGTLSEARNNMLAMDSAIRQAVSEAAGIVKEARLQISEGTYRVNPEAGSIDFDMPIESSVLPRGFYKKEDNLVTSVAGGSSASQNSTHLILRNDILEAVFLKIGSETSFGAINTSNILRTLSFRDGSATIEPNDTSVVIGSSAATSWGLGYSKLAFEGSNLPKAEVLAHVRPAQGAEYEILYTLPASADFLIIEVRNASQNKTTFSYAYRIGTNSSDKLRIGNVTDITFFAGGSGILNQSSILTIQNTNSTRNSSSLLVQIGNIISVLYNSSWGPRNVSELGEIGQGDWKFSSNSTHTSINFTLAGGDGFDYGIRDSAPGGSYWLNQNGTLYGQINISNDFIQVGMTETELKIYNSSRNVIFNTSFNDAVKIDNQNLISLYGSGTQNKTVYFFDWSSQSWKVWTRAATNSTHGVPDWLDPRNKQAFKWRYSFKNDTNMNRIGVNLTFLMTAHDPFVRTFVDTQPITIQTFPKLVYSTPGIYDLTIPSGVTDITIKAWGAGGGGGYYYGSGIFGGGSGGFAQGTISVTPGQVYKVVVGGGGGNPSGGANGGGDGGYSYYGYGGGGGGYSGVFLSSVTQANAIIIAGGGGGGGEQDEIYTGSPGGGGGGYFGGGGGGCANSGGTQTGGGVSCGYPEGTAGSALQGGNGSSGNLYFAGGGGGGGYFGGGGGGNSWGGGYGGGGGSGFVHSSARNTQNLVGSGSSGGSVNTNGQNGLVVIYINIQNNTSIKFSLPENRTSVTTAAGPGIYFTSNASSEEVLFATTNFRNASNNFNITTNKTNFFGFNYTFDNTQNQNFMFTLGTMGRMNTTTFDPQNNVTQFSGETIESVANSTMTWYDLVNGTGATNSTWNVTSPVSGIAQHNATPAFFYDGGATAIWKFDEGYETYAADSSGNGNTGLINGPTWITSSSCRYGSCLSFDGDDYVYSAKNISSFSQGTTIVWIKPGDTSAWVQPIMGRVAATGADVNARHIIFAKILGICPSGDWGTVIANGATFQYVCSGQIYNSTNFPLGYWTQLAVSYDGSYVRFYKDGNLIKTAIQTVSGAGDAQPYSLGGIYFKGFIDEARIYPRALTDTEIREHYQREVSKYHDDFGTAAYGKTYRYFGVEDSNTTMQPITPKDAVVHYRFNENSTSSVSDYSGNAKNATVSGAVWLTNSSCNPGFGGCMSFDGNNRYIMLNPVSFTGDMAVSMWIYPYGTSTFNMLTGDYLSGGTAEWQLGYWGSSNSLQFWRGSTIATTSPGTVTNKTWHHVVLTRIGTGSNNIHIYVDGKERATGTLAGAFGTGTGNKIMIGLDGDLSSEDYAGIIDEYIVLQNRGMTADEVYQLYLGGVNRTVGGKLHRVASADGLQSVTFNLTAKDNTQDGQDYDMRVILVNGTSLFTLPPSPSPTCFTPSDITSPYACSYDDLEFPQVKASGIIHAGPAGSLVSICNDKIGSYSGSTYRFNITSNGLLKVVLPFTTGTCDTVGNGTAPIFRQGLPAAPFGSYSSGSLSNLLLSLQYDNIKLIGDMVLSPGQTRACFKKIGKDGSRIVINATAC
jgi:hypothetical protein